MHNIRNTVVFLSILLGNRHEEPCTLVTCFYPSPSRPVVMPHGPLYSTPCDMTRNCWTWDHCFQLNWYCLPSSICHGDTLTLWVGPRSGYTRPPLLQSSEKSVLNMSYHWCGPMRPTATLAPIIGRLYIKRTRIDFVFVPYSSETQCYSLHSPDLPSAPSHANPPSHALSIQTRIYVYSEYVIT